MRLSKFFILRGMRICSDLHEISKAWGVDAGGRAKKAKNVAENIVEEALDKLQDVANKAQKKVGLGKGAVHGTKVHTEFAEVQKS